MKLITHGRMFLMWREREREGGGEREREFGTTGTVSVETEILERVGDGRESDRQTETERMEGIERYIYRRRDRQSQRGGGDRET